MALTIDCETVYRGPSHSTSKRNDILEWLQSLPEDARIAVDYSRGSLEMRATWKETRDSQPEEKPNYHYQHPDGTTKSMKARWDLALTVQCPNCYAHKGIHCTSLGESNRYLKYPHNKRTKEAQRQFNEAQAQLPLASD